MTKSSKEPGVFSKLMKTFVWTGIFFVPTWIFLLIRMLMSPEGYWQELALGIVGLWVLGGFQLLALIILLIVLAGVWLPGFWSAFFPTIERR